MNKATNCKTCGAEITAKAKICPSCGAKNKLPVYKRIWFWILIVFIVIIFMSCMLGSGNDNNVTDTSDQTISSSDDTVLSSDNETAAPDSESVPESNDNPSSKNEEKLTFVLTAGEAGEYGRMITYNKGTELEENFYAYYVPYGTYTVTNIGDYISQINIYSDEIHITEEGWEEPAEASGGLIEVNESATFTVPEGQHIELMGSDKLKFEMQ